jgi:hypothetical protein
MAGAGRILSPGGILYLYGAYKENGAHTTPSNAAFDLNLRRLVSFMDVHEGELRYRFMNKLYEEWFPVAARISKGGLCVR